MEKRGFLINSIVGITSTLTLIPALAGGFGNIFKSIGKSLGKQSGSEAVALGSLSVRDASQAAVVASRSARASRLLRDFSVATLTSFVADEVLAVVKSAPEDSVVRWTIAYYVMLTKADPEAAMGMWIEPKESHFRHLAAGQSSYFIHGLAEMVSPYSNCKRVALDVSSQNRMESPRRDRIFIDWLYTQNGYRVLKFASV